MEVQAIVKRGYRIRCGKGFSRAELKDAGLTLKQAIKLGIPVDPRRKSKHEENVKALMEHLSKAVLER